MCQVGDIILVNSYLHGTSKVSKHSFVVVNDENGEIKGLSYDFVANAISTFKNERQKQRKMSYPGNFPLVADDVITSPNNGKSTYLKTDQLYYFKKENLNYSIIGNVKPEILDLIFEFINDSIKNGDFEFEEITDNL